MAKPKLKRGPVKAKKLPGAKIPDYNNPVREGLRRGPVGSKLPGATIWGGRPMGF